MAKLELVTPDKKPRKVDGVNQDVIDELESVLALAKAGIVQAVGIAYYKPDDDCVGDVMAWSAGCRWSLVAAINRLANRANEASD
jgi:azurin